MRALCTVTHPQLFHRVLPWCFCACVSIHHVCAWRTKADPLQNRLQSVICTELSLTTGWPWHYSDGDCLTNKHFRFTSAGSSQCCCSGYIHALYRGHLELEKERWPTLLKAPTGPENTLWFHYKNHIMVVNTIKSCTFAWRICSVCRTAFFFFSFSSELHLNVQDIFFCLTSEVNKYFTEQRSGSSAIKR